MAPFFQVGQCALEKVGGLAKGRVQLPALLKLADSAAEPGLSGLVGIAERLQLPLRQVDEGLGVGESLVLGLKCRDAVPAWCRPLKLVDLVVQQGKPFVVVVAAASECLKLPVNGSQLLVNGRHCRTLRLSARKGVEQLALGSGPYQRLVGVLSMDIHELFAQLPQHLQGDGRSVDETAGAAAALDHAADQDLIVAEVALIQPLLNPLVGGVEDGADLSSFSARANDFRIGAVAEAERKSVQQDRFARARLTGECVHAIAKFQIERIDDGEIANVDRSQHSALLRRLRGPVGSADRPSRVSRAAG